MPSLSPDPLPPRYESLGELRLTRLYEFPQSNETVYLSMEFVEGESLRSLLERSGKPAEAPAVAQKYWNPDRAHMVAVGDPSKIRSAPAKPGTVEGAVV